MFLRECYGVLARLVVRGAVGARLYSWSGESSTMIIRGLFAVREVRDTIVGPTGQLICFANEPSQKGEDVILVS